MLLLDMLNWKWLLLILLVLLILWQGFDLKIGKDFEIGAKI